MFYHAGAVLHVIVAALAIKLNNKEASRKKTAKKKCKAHTKKPRNQKRRSRKTENQKTTAARKQRSVEVKKILKQQNREAKKKTEKL